MRAKKPESAALTRRPAAIIGAGLLAVAMVVASSCGQKTTTPAGAKTQAIKAVLTFTRGAVYIERNGKQEAAKANTFLQASDILITKAKASADLMIQGMGAVKLGADSRMAILSLIKKGSGSNAEVRLEQGRAAAFINRKRKGDRFSVVTPTAIAGVRGTVFLTEVKPARPGSKKAPRVRVAVYSGSVAVNLPGQEELVLGKGSQMQIDGFRKLTRKMVRTLSPDSLRAIKKMAVFHKTNVLEFNNMVRDLQSSTELAALQGGAVENRMAVRSRRVARAGLGRDSVQRARRSDSSRVLKREVNRDRLKLKPNTGYQQ